MLDKSKLQEVLKGYSLQTLWNIQSLETLIVVMVKYLKIILSF